MLRFLPRLMAAIFGAILDPVTGNVALTRAGGVTLLTIGTETLISASSTPEVAAGSAVIAAGTALVAARTKSTSNNGK